MKRMFFVGDGTDVRDGKNVKVLLQSFGLISNQLLISYLSVADCCRLGYCADGAVGSEVTLFCGEEITFGRGGRYV